MANEKWTLECLEEYAINYITNEFSNRKNNATKDNIHNDVQRGDRHHPPNWREFRRHLFAEVRRRVRKFVSEGEHPASSLDGVSFSVVNLARRYDLVKFAIQVEVCLLNGPVCTWAVQQLVTRLACAAFQHCRLRDQRPRALAARHLAPALVALQTVGIGVQCSRARLVDIWQRLCSLKTRQLHRLMRAGNKPLAVPPAERLGAPCWELLDTLLLYESDDRMQLVTMKTLECVERYRALVLLVRLQLLLLPPARQQRNSPTRLVWKRVHARYTATGRTGSLILLQRCWHQLCALTRAALKRGDTPMHPLLQLVATELTNTIKQRQLAWSLMVNCDVCVLAGDEKVVKQDRKKMWYIDFKILEKLQTVNQINEYIQRRLRYRQKKYHCRFWEHSSCLSSEPCANMMQIMNNLRDVTDCSLDSDTAQLINNVDKSTNDTATTEALKNIDPKSAQVTVMIETDSDEETSRLRTSNEDTDEFVKDTPDVDEVNLQIQQKSTLDLSSDDCDRTKDEEPRKILTTYTNKILLTVEGQAYFQNRICVNKKNVACRSVVSFIVGENEEAGESNESDSKSVAANKPTFKSKAAQLNKEFFSKKFHIDESDSNEEGCTFIHNKLLLVTCVTLTRIDKTLAWMKYARNNTIDLRRAGFLSRYEKHNRSLRPEDNIKREIDSPLDDGRTSDVSVASESEMNSDADSSAGDRVTNPELKHVSKELLRYLRKKRLLDVCKPVVVKLRKLRDSEISRRGRVVKKVELPHIDEIRRINSNILTAQVKPIPLNEQKRDEADVDMESQLLNLAKDLQLLDNDMRALFSTSLEELQAALQKAIYSDDNKLLTAASGQTARDGASRVPLTVFLDQDKDDEASESEGIVEPVRKRKRSRIKPKKACTVNRPEAPRALNAYEEWERQKQIANIYFAIGKTTPETVTKKHKQDNVETRRNSSGRGPIDGDERVKQPQAAPDRPDVPYRPTVTVTDVGETRQANILTDSFLTHLLNAPPRQPRVENQRYMVISPLVRQSHPALVDNDEPASPAAGGGAVGDSDTPPLLPTITSVCSLAVTETVGDRDASTERNESRRQILPFASTWCSEGSGVSSDRKLTMSLTPMREHIMVKVGDQLVCKTVDSQPKIRRSQRAVPEVNGSSTQEKPAVGDSETPAALPTITAVCSLAATATVRDRGASTERDDNSESPGAPPTSQTFLEKLLARQSAPLNPKLHHYELLEPNPEVPLTATQWIQYNNNKRREERAKWNENYGRRRREREVAGTSQSERGERRRPRAREPLAHSPSELTAEFTTPENYVQTDQRKLLVVAKHGLMEPVWAINNEYVILTEQNLPCESPGYWTVGRDPPGPCQLLVWPKTSAFLEDKNNASEKTSQNSVDSHSNNASNTNNVKIVNNEPFDDCLKNKLVINEGENMDDSSKNRNDFDHDESLTDSVSNDQSDHCMDGSKKSNENYKSVENIDIPNTNDNYFHRNSSDECKTIDIVVILNTNNDGNEPLSKQDSIQVNQNDLDSDKIINEPHNQLTNNVDSDSDSEANELQIVEDDNSVECSNTNPITDNSNETVKIANQNINSNNRASECNFKVIKQDVDDVNSKIIDGTIATGVCSRSKDSESSSNAGHATSVIKVKSFANVGRMESKPVTLDANGNPDVIEKNHKFYKKLLDPPGAAGSSTGSTYALMLSVVTSIDQFERLLREESPLQVLERYRGHVYPLQVAGRNPTSLRHHDRGFLNDLAEKLSSFNASKPVKQNLIYEFQLGKR